MVKWRPPALALVIATTILNVVAIVVAGVLLYDEVFNRLRRSAIDLQLTETDTAVTRIRVTASAGSEVRRRIFNQLRLIPWGHLTRENATDVLFENMLPTLLSHIVNSDVIQGTEVAIMLPAGISHQRNATAYVLCSIYYDIIDDEGTRAYYIIVVAPTFTDQLYLRVLPDPRLGLLKPRIGTEAIFVVNNSLSNLFHAAPNGGESVAPYATETGRPYFFTTSYEFRGVGDYVMEVAVYALLDSWYAELVSLAVDDALLIIVDPLTNVVISTNDIAETNRQLGCFTHLNDFFADRSCIRQNYSNIGSPLIHAVVSSVSTPEWARIGAAVSTTVHEVDVLGDDYFVIVAQLVNNDGVRPIFLWASPVGRVVVPLRTQTIRIVSVAAALLFVVSLIGSVVSSFLVARPIHRVSSKLNAVHLVEGATDKGGSERRHSLVLEVASLEAHYANLATSMASFVLYVPKTVVTNVLRQRLVAEPSVSPTHAVVMFVDMTGFTSMWAARGDAHASELMRRYFDAVGGALSQRGGVIDKYIGDIVMCVWELSYDKAEGQRQCADAMHAAIEIREAIEVDTELRQHVEVNVGCHAGEVLMGNVGSRWRLNYTILGDSVNTASRVLKKSRDFQQRRLATAALVEGCGPLKTQFLLSEFQPFRLKGKEELVRCCTYIRAGDGHEPFECVTLDLSVDLSLSMSVGNVYTLED